MGVILLEKSLTISVHLTHSFDCLLFYSPTRVPSIGPFFVGNVLRDSDTEDQHERNTSVHVDHWT